MNLVFSLGSSQMSLESAVEILKMAAKPNLAIALDDAIDVNKLDPNRLTQIAMATDNRKLMEVAWNLRNVKPAKKVEPRLPTLPQKSEPPANVLPMRNRRKSNSIEDMLAYVDKYKNTSILGIGLILHRAYMLKDKGNQSSETPGPKMDGGATSFEMPGGGTGASGIPGEGANLKLLKLQSQSQVQERSLGFGALQGSESLVS